MVGRGQVGWLHHDSGLRLELAVGSPTLQFHPSKIVSGKKDEDEDEEEEARPPSLADERFDNRENHDFTVGILDQSIIPSVDSILQIRFDVPPRKMMIYQYSIYVHRTPALAGSTA
jgi:hypothetical protein